MSAAAPLVAVTESATALIQQEVDRTIDDLLSRLPEADRLSPRDRRGLLARYAVVLEGNFIYWMTGALIAVGSDEARARIIENLREEIRECHPGMLRRFAAAAHAVPTDADAHAVCGNLMNVRLFVGRLSAVPTVVMMAFFEGFIQRFMSYLADLARRQGSTEMEYTDVHGICDVAHTQDLYRALDAEMVLAPPLSKDEIYEGVALLRTLIENIVWNN